MLIKVFDNDSSDSRNSHWWRRVSRSWSINMEMASSARREPLTYWVTHVSQSGKAGLFQDLGKVCSAPCKAFLNPSPVKLFSLLIQGFSPPVRLFSFLLLQLARLFSTCEASQNSCPSLPSKLCRAKWGCRVLGLTSFYMSIDASSFSLWASTAEIKYFKVHSIELDSGHNMKKA